jgi:PAS domain S-box-containing protein
VQASVKAGEKVERPLRVLIVEDHKSDVFLLLSTLRAGGFDVTYEVVATEAAMRAALDHPWDLITSDHSMPQFSGPAALALALELRPDVPFVIVSGEIDINLAVSLIQGGAQDYVQKSELVRLVPVVRRVLRERAFRNDKLLADQALIASEVQYRRLFESAQDGILIVDAQTGQIRDVNPYMLDLLGFSREEYLGKKLWEVSAFRDSEASKSAFLELQQRGYIRYDNIPLRAKNGNSIEVEFVSNVYDAGHQRVIQCNIRDITERRRGEDKQKSHAALLDQASDAIMVRDPENRVIFINRAAQHMYGLSAEGASGRVSHDLLQTKFPIPLATIEVALATNGNWEGELRHITNQGVEIVVASRWTLQRDEQGVPTAILEINRDITERKRAEEMRERLAAIVDSSEDAIISKTLDGKITAWNRGAEKVFGYSAAEIVGKSISVLLPPERIDEESDILARIRRGESVEHFETVRVRKDGTNIDVSVTISPIRDGTGGIVGASKIARDITERKRTEEALREKEHLLSESQRIAHIGSWSLDPKDSTGGLVWSDEMYRIYGVSRGTFTPTVEEFLMRIVPEDRSAIRQWMVACAAGEKPGDVEFRLRLPDGAVRVFSGHGELQDDTDNKPLRMTGTLQDITERSLQDQALRKSAAFLEQTGRLAGFGGWDIDVGTNTVIWGTETYRILGADPAYRPTLQEALDLYTPEFRPVIAAAVEKASVDGEGWDLEASLIGLDGRFIWARVVGTVEFADGRPVRLIGVFQDITARIAAQQAVEEAQARTALATKSSGIGIWDWDLRSGEFNCDTLVYQLFGLEPECDKLHDLAFWAGRVHSQDRAAVGQALQDCIDGIKPYDIEYRNVWDDGSIHYIRGSGKAIRDQRGVALRMVGTSMDITDRKRSEADLAQRAEELRYSRQALETQAVMLQTVLDSMVEGLVATDKQGKFILWNPAARKIMGLGPTDLPSTEWSANLRLFLPDTVTPILPGQTPLERTLRGEAGTTEIFLRHAGVNQGIWLDATGSPLIDKDGTMRGAVVAFRDITRRKTDEMEIRKLNEDLEEKIATRTEQLQATNHELETFSYSVSHDLRSPLRHIASYSKILVSDYGPEMPMEAREHLRHIEAAVSRMGLLIDALLKMAVLHQRALRLDQSELNAIVDEVISMLEPECQGRDVEWRIAKLPALDCDPVLMAQVFQNLIGNALKYSRGRPKAVIEVGSIQQPDKPPIIFVRDNGAGFNMDYAEKLFGVFQRFHRESEFEGTGVGLATVQRIIRKHGGMIWAEAEPDHGATFYFSLQMTEQIRTTPKATAPS